MSATRWRGRGRYYLTLHASVQEGHSAKTRSGYWVSRYHSASKQAGSPPCVLSRSRAAAWL